MLAIHEKQEFQFFQVIDSETIREYVKQAYEELIFDREDDDGPYVFANDVMGYMLHIYAEELCLRYAYKGDITGGFDVPEIYRDAHENDPEKWNELVEGVIEFADYNMSFGYEQSYGDIDFAFRDDVVRLLHDFRFPFCYRNEQELIYHHTPLKEVW